MAAVGSWKLSIKCEKISCSFIATKGVAARQKDQQENAELAKYSVEGREVCNAWKAIKMDYQAMGTFWLTTLPRF
jgi:hypothetical protein